MRLRCSKALFRGPSVLAGYELSPYRFCLASAFFKIFNLSELCEVFREDELFAQCVVIYVIHDSLAIVVLFSQACCDGVIESLEFSGNRFFT